MSSSLAAGPVPAACPIHMLLGVSSSAAPAAAPADTFAAPTSTLAGASLDPDTLAPIPRPRLAARATKLAAFGLLGSVLYLTLASLKCVIIYFVIPAVAASWLARAPAAPSAFHPGDTRAANTLSTSRPGAAEGPESQPVTAPTPSPLATPASADALPGDRS